MITGSAQPLVRNCSGEFNGGPLWDFRNDNPICTIIVHDNYHVLINSNLSKKFHGNARISEILRR